MGLAIIFAKVAEDNSAIYTADFLRFLQMEETGVATTHEIEKLTGELQRGTRTFTQKNDQAPYTDEEKARILLLNAIERSVLADLDYSVSVDLDNVHRLMGGSDVLPVSGQLMQRSDVLPVSGQLMQRSDVLPVSGQLMQRSDVLPVSGQLMQRSDVLPVSESTKPTQSFFRRNAATVIGGSGMTLGAGLLSAGLVLAFTPAGWGILAVAGVIAGATVAGGLIGLGFGAVADRVSGSGEGQRGAVEDIDDDHAQSVGSPYKHPGLSSPGSSNSRSSQHRGTEHTDSESEMVPSAPSRTAGTGVTGYPGEDDSSDDNDNSPSPHS